jgi:hypothetical protein
MTKKKGLRLLGAIGVVLLLLMALLSWARPWWLYCVRTVIDVNSGDIARQTYVCGRQVREDIEESVFSREVRRLGIAVPKGRHWRSVGDRYVSLVTDCKMTIFAMDRLKMPDAERSTRLAEILAIMQAEDIDMRRLGEMMSQLGQKLLQLPGDAERQMDVSGDEVTN